MPIAAVRSLCLPLALVAFACSGDDDDATDDGAGSASSAATVADDGADGFDDDDGPGDGGGPTTGPAATGTTDAATDDGNDDTGASTGDPDDGSTGAPVAMPPPTQETELLAWLRAGEYLSWTAESGVHGSTGPHFGDVRTFVDDVLLQSLTAGNATHPVDAAAVKELYGATGSVQGWSVLVKVADGPGGDTWYFLEHYDGTTYGDGVGDGTCTGCHGAGSLDYFKSPFPLQ